MAWSTRRLAQLGGTTVKTIRHYHDIGLLEQPERAANGYKQYGTSHLVRILQIAHLRELGMEPAEIATMDDSDEAYVRTLHELDTRLAESIAHQQQLRAEIGALLRHRAASDTPTGYADLADSLTSADRAMVMVNSQLLDAAGVQDMKDIVTGHQDGSTEFDELGADASADEIHAVAVSLTPVLETIYDQYPTARRPPLRARTADSLRDLAEAVTSLYNPAQVEALRQAYQLVHSPPEQEEGSAARR